MINRAEQLKAYREYRETVQEAEKKKPDDNIFWKEKKEGEITYSHSNDVIAVNLLNLFVVRSGKYPKSFQAAINSLMGKSIERSNIWKNPN
ncbi:MAG: hypothetical protein LBD44_05940 [Spirochaetaceae bacterium]|nr:hypothetical protein [Spirochaetaceae bacterium]